MRGAGARNPAHPGTRGAGARAVAPCRRDAMVASGAGARRLGRARRCTIRGSSPRGGLRTFALILILLGTVVLGYDAVIFLDRGVFPMTPIGQIWALIHRNSLLLLQPAIERHVHPGLSRTERLALA